MTTTADGSTGPATARRPGRPRTAERAARRAGLLDVAIQIFGARGYGATTIEAVASEAGVTKRTIYQHFTDKAGLFVAAVESQHAHEHTITGEDLESLATRIVRTLHGDQAVTLHRLVIAEALQFPDLAAAFYTHGPASSTEALAHHLAVHLGAAPSAPSALSAPSAPVDDATRSLAEALYTLLLGEAHRRRLLGLAPAPTVAQAREHAHRAVTTVCGPRRPLPDLPGDELRHPRRRRSASTSD
ncbi:TetR/AcrR family transcriptional regulator [Oerskovia rustica]|uniref:TetR/AcrR family transcriptional regulator n=1 Tax=Oerskovia rustica TaxID=2762237 RepID=A0ABR8RS81_9CELL|nr:TetR/AcrR family transcriptional regulator [Oerskovia rustica]MBD7950644.1 TetR/AcrR family transcriptional regulator [Oerskovia rustica]